MQRKIKIITDYISNPESSILIESGNTKVICNVTLDHSVPVFLKDTGKGWVTAEYSMLPSATKTRNRREVISGKISGRTAEIQRMIGRSLRAVIDLTKMPGYTAVIDCDVIQADGGTRSASITGAGVALYFAFENYIKKGIFNENPMKELVAAISVGMYKDTVVVDMDHEMDQNAQVDMNIVMTESGKYVEIQGTGEECWFTREQMNDMLNKAEIVIKNLINYQKEVIRSKNNFSV